MALHVNITKYYEYQANEEVIAKEKQMEKTVDILNDERWVFKHENRMFRYALAVIVLLISIYSYGVYNLFVGSLFVFLFLYFLGTFKDRKKIDLLLNEDPVNVASKITNLVNTGRNEIKVLTGSINPQVYCHKDVLKAFDKAIERGVEVYFITNWDLAEKNSQKNGGNDIVNWAKENRLKIYDFGDNVENINHFIVVDKKSFRVEGLHDPNADTRLAVTAFNNKRAQKFLKFFDYLIKNNQVELVYPKRKFTLAN